MRIALAGVGAAASNGHLPALLWLESEGRVKVVGACDPDEHRRVAARRLFPGIPTFALASEMLQSVNSELTVIAAHPAVHADLAADAANHHQHILCEKPAGGTLEQLSQFAAIRERHPDRALIASYQYRFSPTWIALTPFLRAAARSNEPVYMSVEVERCATDPRAMSSWRDDPAMGGGLADHAVHFLALARELGGSLIVETASRDYDHQRRERVTARVSVGLNPVDLSVSYGAAARSTTVKLRAGDLVVRWRDRELRVDQGGRRGHPLVVRALSDKSYVDALYCPMYLDLLAGVRNPEWCRDRAEELFEVGKCLIGLLADAESASQFSPELAALAA